MTSKDEIIIKGLSRREFIKAASVGASTLAVGGVLSGCAPKTAAVVTEQPSASVEQTGSTAQKYSFEVPPAPISDSQISNTVETEIVVVGSGTAGLVCANSAVDHGAKVILISASEGNISRGGSNHAMNSKLMQANADKFPIPDISKTIRTELLANSYNIDQDKLWKFGKYSEEAMNWLIDKMAPSGATCVLENTYHDPTGVQDIVVGSHSWINDTMKAAGMGQQIVVDYLAETAKAAGVQIFYKTVAEQLVRENNNTGRVTAVIAKGPDGKYTKYVGSKAIVLATGDFSADREMMEKYCPQALPLLNDTGDKGYDNEFKMGGLFKGDGQKMGLWVGAAWQKTFPNCAMVGGGAGPSPQAAAPSHPGLLVNKKGYRFGNEDAFGALEGWSQMHQPDMLVYAIWGQNFAEAVAPWYAFGGVVGDPPIPVEEIKNGWDKAVEAGTYVKGNTIEEVISKLGLPSETKATVDHYNEMAKNGVDEDYLKRKELLVPIDTAPFYGSAGGTPQFLTVLGGLRTNIHMQVCDKNDEPIPGLYNLGTMIGDFFANVYNFMLYGLNLGASCVTMGYLTGKEIATSA